jgi:2-amino-4-hydroxy-6-hydroxymethyldihydropteridine diphosphokinase
LRHLQAHHQILQKNTYLTNTKVPFQSKKVILLLGSNLGNRIGALRFAAAELAIRVGPLVSASAVFESEPWGSKSESWFANQAIEFTTTLPPQEVLSHALAIEQAWGRTRSTPNADRTLDIDILWMEEVVIDEPNLQIPHPRLLDRRFALAPFAQIAPELPIPPSMITVSQALINCPDLLEVRSFNPHFGPHAHNLT